MTKQKSIYFDLLRGVAAILVMLGHFADTRFSGGKLYFLDYFLHDAVIIFFVLSGYIIAYIADQRDNSSIDYIINRLSRLYSVILPALLLTFILDPI